MLALQAFRPHACAVPCHALTDIPLCMASPCLQAFIREEIAGFVPKPSDLDYPERLQRTQQQPQPAAAPGEPQAAPGEAQPAAEGAQQQGEAAAAGAGGAANGAAADAAAGQQAAGWYPPVERCLLLLGKLYR